MKFFLDIFKDKNLDFFIHFPLSSFNSKIKLVGLFVNGNHEKHQTFIFLLDLHHFVKDSPIIVKISFILFLTKKRNLSIRILILKSVSICEQRHFFHDLSLVLAKTRFIPALHFSLWSLFNGYNTNYFSLKINLCLHVN